MNQNEEFCWSSMCKLCFSAERTTSTRSKRLLCSPSSNLSTRLMQVSGVWSPSLSFLLVGYSLFTKTSWEICTGALLPTRSSTTDHDFSFGNTAQFCSLQYYFFLHLFNRFLVCFDYLHSYIIFYIIISNSELLIIVHVGCKC